MARLRKFLRSRRVTSVGQVGTDRIIELKFSDGQYRLYLEFYAGGNIILTDQELCVLALLRTVPESPEQETLRVGVNYSLTNRQNYHGVAPLTRDRVRSGIQNAIIKLDSAPPEASKKAKRKPGEALRQAIAASVTEFSPMLVEHSLYATGFDTSINPKTILEDDSILDGVMRAMEEAQRLMSHLATTGRNEGYIIAKSARPNIDASLLHEDPAEAVREGKLRYDDFHPFKPHHLEQSKNHVFIPYRDFNTTLDEFFSSVESQKLETRLNDKEESAKRKLEHARQDHQKRLGGLQQAQELHVRKAQAIEANVQRVQEAIGAVNSLLSQEMDWQNIAKLIEVEQQRKNVVADTIKLPLKLYENTITLLLSEETFEDEAYFDGDETDSVASDSEGDIASTSKKTAAAQTVPKALEIDVDLSLSPWVNARQYYDQKKTAAVKEQKTAQSSEMALKSAERKIGADLKKSLQHEKDVMRPQRQALWFEKFLYFISSEGYLILGGKDAQQTEILYKRHFRKGDYYVHADLNGAVSVIVKNKPNAVEDPIPPSTLSQAGTLCVSTSNAWDSKAVMAAWWVPAAQVSKIASNGDLLVPGLFNIKGERNFLPPAQLLLGFGLLFKVSQESKARHHKHRVLDNASAPRSKDSQALPTEQSDVEGADIPKDLEDAVEDLQIGSSSDSEAETVQQEDEEPEVEIEKDDTQSVNPLQPDGPIPTNVETEDQLLNQHVESTQAGDDGDNVNNDYDIDVAEDQNLPDGDIESQNSAQHDSDKVGDAAITETSAAAAAVTPAKAHSNVRGKRGKRQKQKTKYAHQDEEDRALAMKLLGSAAAQDRVKDLAAEKEAKEKEAAEQKERRRQQHLQNAKKGKEAELARQKRLEAGIQDDDDDDVEVETPVEDLDAFVGAPLPGDEILDVLVVCGPWDAMGARCRWRAKLQPGTTKKGRAVKEILARWNGILQESEKKKRPGAGAGNETMLDEERVRQREAELIRGIRDVEVVGILPVGKVRVVLGAGEKAMGSGKGGGGGGGKGGKGRKGGKGSKKK